MTHPSDVESARLSMMEARRVLEEYEARKDASSSKIHAILRNAFQKATHKYLRLSSPK